MDQTIELHTINQTLEDFEKEMKHASEFPEEGYTDKGKKNKN